MHSQGTKNMIDEIQRFVQENQALDSLDANDKGMMQDSFDDQKSKSSSVNTKLAKFLSLNSAQ